jgi:Enoyl-(Acyl carrier protein) reductase
MAVDDFMAPPETAARMTFLTARAAARHMICQRSGVILAFGGPGDRSGPTRDYYLGGTQVAFDAIETIRRQLAVELGPHGVRVVTHASGGVPESIPEGFDGRQAIVEMIERQTLLGRAATLEDVGNADRLRRLRLGAHHDGSDCQRQLRRARRLAKSAGRELWHPRGCESHPAAQLTCGMDDVQHSRAGRRSALLLGQAMQQRAIAESAASSTRRRPCPSKRQRMPLGHESSDLPRRRPRARFGRTGAVVRHYCSSRLRQRRCREPLGWAQEAP